MAPEKSSGSQNIKVYQRGQKIFEEGDLGEEMYIIKSGKVEVIREMGDGSIILASLKQSEFFGEMALFGDPKRSATIQTAERTELFVITKAMLEAQFKKIPEWLVVMIKTIASRIISTIKGVKARFPMGMDYSILKTLIFLLEEHGSSESQDKAMSISLSQARHELEDITGMGIDDIDDWLKKLNFVNLIKMISSREKLLIPDIERIEKYTEYLEVKNAVTPASEIKFDKNLFASFERLHKLLRR